MTSDVELSGVRIPPGDLVIICSGMGIWQNLLIPTSSGRAAACATNIAFGMGIRYCLGAPPSRAMKAAVSPNAFWTVFRVQTKSELLPSAALLMSFATFFQSPHF